MRVPRPVKLPRNSMHHLNKVRSALVADAMSVPGARHHVPDGTAISMYRSVRKELSYHALKQCLTCKRVYQLTRGWEKTLEQAAADRPRLRLPVRLCALGRPRYEQLKELEPLMRVELELLRGAE